MSEKVRDKVKDALHMMPYGFYSVTTSAGDDVNAMVANWIIQSSFEPRQITMAMAKDAYSYGLVKKGRAFAINLFNKEDAELIKPLTKSRTKNPDKVANLKYSRAPVTGCPVIDGAAAYVECKVVQIIDTGGDHNLLVGDVVGADVMKKGEAIDTLNLTDIGWSYAG